jgi:hypothetical protein
MTLNRFRFFLEIIMTREEMMQERKWLAMQDEIKKIATFDSEKHVWFVDDVQQEKVWEIYHRHFGYPNKDQLNLF